MTDSFTRVWHDYVDDLDEEAMNDLEERMEGRNGGVDFTTIPTVTGSRGGNAALASLLTALDDMGLINNSTSA